jgi:hypothetical protein
VCTDLADFRLGRSSRDSGGPPQQIDLMCDATHPDRETDTTVHHDREANLFLTVAHVGTLRQADRRRGRISRPGPDRRDERVDSHPANDEPTPGGTVHRAVQAPSVAVGSRTATTSSNPARQKSSLIFQTKAQHSTHLSESFWRGRDPLRACAAGRCPGSRPGCGGSPAPGCATAGRVRVGRSARPGRSRPRRCPRPPAPRSGRSPGRPST